MNKKQAVRLNGLEKLMANMDKHLIPVSEVPQSLMRGFWVRQFLRIPKGKAWVITERDAKELGVKAHSIVTALNHYRKLGRIPKSFSAMQVSDKDGAKLVYIINRKEDVNGGDKA